MVGKFRLKTRFKFWRKMSFWVMDEKIKNSFKSLNIFFHWKSSLLVLRCARTVFANAGCVQFATSCLVSSSITAALTLVLSLDFMFCLTTLSPEEDIISSISTLGTISSRNLSGQTTDVVRPRLTASLAVAVLPNRRISLMARCPEAARVCDAKHSGICPSLA